MSRFPVYLITLCFLISSCAPFIIKKNKPLLEELEKKKYLLKKEVKIDELHLKKGEKVQIRIAEGKNWIKVYAFPTKKDPLKVKWVLILYMFDDEFKKKKFDLEIFKAKLFEFISETK